MSICDSFAGKLIGKFIERYCKDCPDCKQRNGDASKDLLRIFFAIQKKADPSEVIDELRRR